MSELFDIQAAAEAISAQEDVVTLQSPLSRDRQEFDTEGKCAVVEGDIDRELLLRCEKSLLVRGAIAAGEGAVSKLEVGGEAVVTGSVHCGHITAMTVRLAGRTEKSHLVAEGDVVIGAELLESDVVTGDYQARRHRLDTLNWERERLVEEREHLQRQLALDEKRMDKACTVTRTPLNFTVGKIVQSEKGRLRIDLSSFYRSVADRPETDVDLSPTSTYR